MWHFNNIAQIIYFISKRLNWGFLDARRPQPGKTHDIEYLKRKPEYFFNN